MGAAQELGSLHPSADAGTEEEASAVAKAAGMQGMALLFFLFRRASLEGALQGLLRALAAHTEGHNGAWS